jgi:pyridoxine 4-dehydrogenase
VTLQRSGPAAAAGTVTIGGDLTVNRMGFGAMRITGRGIWGQPSDRDRALGVLRRAVELGVDFIDTADAYGPEVSENLIAEALHPYDGVVIATKGGLVRGGPGRWQRDGSPEHLREACDGSLRRLRVDSIDVYQLHAVDRKVPIEDSVGALVELQRAGKIKHIGLSNVSSKQLRRAQEVAEVVSVQNSYNVADRTSENELRDCEQQGIAFIAYYPIGAGRLATARVLDEIAKSHSASAVQVAMAWLLARSPLMLPIPGTSLIDHLEENVGAASLKLGDEDVGRLNHAVRV